MKVDAFASQRHYAEHLYPIWGRNRGVLNTGTGRVRMMAADQRNIAALLDELARDPERVRAQQELSLGWAQAHTWDAMLPLYRDELALAADKREHR